MMAILTQLDVTTLDCDAIVVVVAAVASDDDISVDYCSNDGGD